MSDTKKKKNFLFFSVESDEVEVPVASQPQSTFVPSPSLTPGVIAPIVSSANPVTVNTVIADNEFSSKVKEMLNALYEKSNIPGTDYFEFQKAVETLRARNATYPEQMLFDTCFVSLQAKYYPKDLENFIDYSKAVDKSFTRAVMDAHPELL